MGCIVGNGVAICDNFAEVQDKKPENFDYMSDANWLETYPKDWERIKIGKTTCDCKQVETHYAPYYGFTWYHSKECALIKRVEAQPQLMNLPAFWNVETIGYSE